MASIKQQKEISVTYDANRGTGAPSPDTKIEGIDLTLNTTTVPTRKGMVFECWFKDSPKSGNVVTKLTEDEDCVVYAHWKLAPIMVGPSKTLKDDSYSGAGKNYYHDACCTFYLPEAGTLYYSSYFSTHTDWTQNITAYLTVGEKRIGMTAIDTTMAPTSIGSDLLKQSFSVSVPAWTGDDSI